MGRRSGTRVEQKLKVVKSVLEGKLSARRAGEQFGISHKTIQGWVTSYQAMGEEGLTPSPTNKHYPASLKLSAVKEYLSGDTSLAEICKKYAIRADYQLRKWIAVYIGHGEFRNPHTGGSADMSKGRKTTQEERIEIVSDCIAHGKDYGRTIERFGVSYQQIYSWVRKYEDHGVEGLSDRRGKRKDEASMNEVERLQAQIKLKAAENYRLKMENDLLKKLAEIERRWERG